MHNTGVGIVRFTLFTCCSVCDCNTNVVVCAYVLEACRCVRVPGLYVRLESVSQLHGS